MDTHALTVSPNQPGTIYLANRMGLFRSSDRGDHWSELGIGRFSPLTYARDVQVSPHDPGRYYAALSVAAVSDAGALWRSDDAAGSKPPAGFASRAAFFFGDRLPEAFSAAAMD